MKIEVTAHVHMHNSDGALLRLLQTIAVKLDVITKRQIMGNATLDQALDAITQETTLVGGVTTLVTSLKQQVADALSGTKLPPDVQAKVQAIFDGASANNAKLADALVTNTDPAPGDGGSTGGTGATGATGSTPDPNAP